MERMLVSVLEKLEEVGEEAPLAKPTWSLTASMFLVCVEDNTDKLMGRENRTSSRYSS
jgi:hypothetical protein